jgi:hypothetical protein
MAPMGFPDWTLLGMGLSALGALLALLLALMAQSPRLLGRVGLGGRFAARARAFTGYAFALLLLAMGFFLAGVPLGEAPESSSGPVAAASSATPGAVDLSQEGSAELETSQAPAQQLSSQPATPVTGAFAGPPSTATTDADVPSAEAIGPPAAQADTPEPQLSETSPVLPTPSISPSETPTDTSTPTPTPTMTPSPTITPTPILGETAELDLDGGTVWLRRSPGGPNLLVLNDNELVLLLAGHANQGGVLWRQVSTVDGQEGWLPDALLLPQG